MQMNLSLRPANLADLEFARELTRANMRRYYVQYQYIWQGDLFDTQWQTRQSYIIVKTGKQIGYFSVSLEPAYLYLRDVQLSEPYRGEGVGAWVLQHLAPMANELGVKSIRLKVFKSNPALVLYQRHGYAVSGEEDALFWMERVLDD